MNMPESPVGQTKYYDPAEVEAYIRDVTATMKALQARLHEAVRRAQEAERALSDHHPETTSLGRALLLAGEVAEKTVADADARAAAVVRAAEDRAAGIIESAQAEARRLVDSARAAATDTFHIGEARLLAALNAFTDGADGLRAELAKIQEETTSWRTANRRWHLHQPSLSIPSPPPHRTASPPPNLVSETPEPSVPMPAPSLVTGPPNGIHTDTRPGNEVPPSPLDWPAGDHDRFHGNSFHTNGDDGHPVA